MAILSGKIDEKVKPCSSNFVIGIMYNGMKLNNNMEKYTYTEQKGNSPGMIQYRTRTGESTDNKNIDFNNFDLNYYLELLRLRPNKSIVLSPDGHYFFKKDELEKTDLVISQKSLNRVKNLKSFLKNINSNIPEGCYFTGCLESQEKKHGTVPEYYRYLYDEEMHNIQYGKESGIKLNLFDRILNMLNLTGRPDKENLTALLNETGFSVRDILEINGKIYFCTQKSGDFTRAYSLS